MSMHYELWHVPSGTLVNTYTTESAAFAPVLRVLREQGRAAAEEFALASEDARGRTRRIADGAALVERALTATAADSSRRLA